MSEVTSLRESYIQQCEKSKKRKRKNSNCGQFHVIKVTEKWASEKIQKSTLYIVFVL